jgi:hypothetical protein
MSSAAGTREIRLPSQHEYDNGMKFPAERLRPNGFAGERDAPQTGFDYPGMPRIAPDEAASPTPVCLCGIREDRYWMEPL